MKVANDATAADVLAAAPSNDDATSVETRSDASASRARDTDPHDPDRARRRALLVWDAPNLDMGLGAILGSRPTAAYRPRFDALGRWLLHLAADLSTELGEPIEAEATVFTNIAPGSAEVVRPWVEALRNVGFAVFAKPKIDEDSDVDSDMLEHIRLRSATDGLAAVLVASADGQAFRRPLETLAGEGVEASVLGFREHAGWALTSDLLDFVDLEDIPGVFREPLPRVSLDSLPDEGAWLQPFRPLSSLLSGRQGDR
ncbi:NYN domain-containing protein [Millisia brevis]|uniref:NYN domain-containing protein n=1 Tax=Millisia brevis TaxID=264148 RepID=UPI00082B4145|nr:NYN domain-containing protein [Millisia brevis]